MNNVTACEVGHRGGGLSGFLLRDVIKIGSDRKVDMRPRLLLAVGLFAFTIACKGKPPVGPSDPPQSPAPPAAQRSTGPIAFVSDRDGTEQIYLANEDGSAVTRLTPGHWPTWSPDGQRLAFHRTDGIYVINVDGSGLRYLTRGWDPDWSPDGRSIVFRDPTFSITTIDVNGANVRRLSESTYGDTAPAWSPDGRRIAFNVGGSTPDCPPEGLWSMNADGSGLQLINCYVTLPAWSPRSPEIAFVNLGKIELSNADGSSRRTVVGGPAAFPDWTPDGRLIFTTDPSRRWYGPGQRIFISDGGVERQLIPEAVAPAFPSYSDRQATWRR